MIAYTYMNTGSLYFVCKFGLCMQVWFVYAKTVLAETKNKISFSYANNVYSHCRIILPSFFCERFCYSSFILINLGTSVFCLYEFVFFTK